MFCAYSWFEKPELYASIRATSLEWARAGERSVFLETGQNESHLSPQKRALSAAELVRLKERKDLPFDAIMANIFAANLINLCGAISDALRPGGLLISSGIPANDVSEVAAAFEAVGLELLEHRELFGWNALVHRKV